MLDPPANFSFEGAGDALFCGDTLYAGYRMRSDAAGHQAIGRMLGVRVIPVELVDPRYYHLDTCFCPLAPDTAIWYPPAFDDYGQRAIQQHVPNLLAVEQAEAERFACNAVVIGRTVITNTGCDQLHAALAAADYDPGRHAARRIRQSGRQREVPYAAARWRRSGRVADFAYGRLSMIMVPLSATLNSGRYGLEWHSRAWPFQCQTRLMPMFQASSLAAILLPLPQGMR